MKTKKRIEWNSKMLEEASGMLREIGALYDELNGNPNLPSYIGDGREGSVFWFRSITVKDFLEEYHTVFKNRILEEDRCTTLYHLKMIVSIMKEEDTPMKEWNDLAFRIVHFTPVGTS